MAISAIFLAASLLQLSHTNNFPCDRPGCHKRFRTQEDLDVHARRHRGERPFQCSDCEEGFSTKSELRTHQQKHTGGW